jgi:peptidoglycan-N-acetylglucosamine deacetylase
VPTLGYSRRVPPRRTSVPGVELVTSAQIVNGTLNVNETVQLAERAASELVGAGARRVAKAPRGGLSRPGRLREEPLATLSIDLDNLWSYLKTRGDGSWTSFPSFLELVVPRVMRFLADRQQSITWFVVGKDAASGDHRALLAAVAAAGHEIGNHSFLHEPWLHRFPSDRLEEEVARTEQAIEEATGLRPTGFRSPGYSLSREVLVTLERRGYRYDASTLPTFMGPLARAFYLRNAQLSRGERSERDALFGSFGEGTRPIKPYRWRLDGGGLVEVPVTTMPLVRTPIHMSYLVYLAERSPALAMYYFKTALQLCRWTGVAPSLLLHSHDFVGADDVPAMSFFPGARLPGRAKMRLVGRCIDLLRTEFKVMPLSRYVDGLEDLKMKEPRFSNRHAPHREDSDVRASGERRP